MLPSLPMALLSRVIVVALLQPTPEVYGLFDDVMLQREGAIVFHGARGALPGHMRAMGFLPPRAGEGEDEADWLAEWLTFPGARQPNGKPVTSSSPLAQPGSGGRPPR
jgi:hypothetical protein